MAEVKFEDDSLSVRETVYPEPKPVSVAELLRLVVANPKKVYRVSSATGALAKYAFEYNGATFVSAAGKEDFLLANDLAERVRQLEATREKIKAIIRRRMDQVKNETSE